MEIIGDDKRIRALFSEVRFADGQAAPSFTSMWHRAESRALKPRRAFNLSFVAATALLIFALASLAVWSKFSQGNLPANEAFAVVSAGSAFTRPQITNELSVSTATPATKTSLVKSLVNRPAAQRHLLMVARNRKAAEEAKQIASWTSPTASLLSSSSDDLFKSLPQLNENATDLKSFLPTRSNNKEN